MTQLHQPELLTSFAKISNDRKHVIIRARLLKRAGVLPRKRPRSLPLCRNRKVPTETAPTATSNVETVQPLEQSCLSDLQQMQQSEVFSEPIKIGKESCSRLAKKSIVQFRNEVSVVHIKSYRDYPQGTLERMYSTRKEIKANMKRNKLEFVADRKDWRNALEEEEMYVNDDGEYVHPVHSLGLPRFLRKTKRFARRRHDE